MHSRLAPYFGTVLNLLVVSVPLLFLDITLAELSFLTLISNPTILFFYSLVSIFCFLESKASVQSSSSLAQHNERPYLPYFASVSVLIVFWVSLYSYFQVNPIDNTLGIVIASIITLAGVLIRILSIQTLDAFFVSHIGLVKQHQLVKSGLYSVVRHPSELGLLLICLGVPLLMSSIYGLVITLLIILPLSLYRVLLEDKMINAAFGADFVNYKSSVPALIPNLLQREIHVR